MTKEFSNDDVVERLENVRRSIRHWLFVII